jgi:hypothetical protein
MDRTSERNSGLPVGRTWMAASAGAWGSLDATSDERLTKEGIVRTRLLEPADLQRWERFVETRPNATAYHQIGWKQVIEKAFGHKTYYLLSQDEQEELTGILPLVHLKSALFGNYMVSLPFVNYGGCCSDDVETTGALIQAAAEVARKHGSKHIEFRDRSPGEQGLPVKTSKVTMLKGLPGRAEQLWETFTPKLRSQIRKPQKEVSIRCSRPICEI